MKEQTAVGWLVEQLTPSISLQQKHIDDLKEKAKAMDRQQQKDILMDIDLDLAMIEDYAKGELGNNITELRVKIDKLLQRNKES